MCTYDSFLEYCARKYSHLQNFVDFQICFLTRHLQVSPFHEFGTDCCLLHAVRSMCHLFPHVICFEFYLFIMFLFIYVNFICLFMYLLFFSIFFVFANFCGTALGSLELICYINLCECR